MTGTLQPLDSKFPIVDVRGNPTNYFIRWAQQKQIDIGSSITLTDLTNYLAAHTLIAGTGIQLTPDGNIADGVTIHADAQAILDEITATRGAILYRGLLGWAALLPGTATYLLQTNGAGADPTWVAPPAGGGGGALALLGTVTSTGVSGTMTLGSIPSTAKDLIIVLVGRTDNAAAQVANVSVNGTPIGDIQRLYAQGGAASADQLLAASISGFMIAFPGTGYTAGMVAHQEMTIFEYANTNFWKNFYLVGRQPNSTTTGNAYVLQAAGDFRTLSAINSITATLAAGNWVSGSVMRVYGRT